MRLERPILPPRLHKPKPPQDPHTPLIPRIHIRHHPLYASLPKHPIGAQQRGESFGHVPFAPDIAVEQKPDFGVREAPDAGFADHLAARWV